MNNRWWVGILGIFLVSGLTSCGGGGGGGGDKADLLPYTGLATPAVLDAANVVELTEIATYGAGNVSSYPPDIMGASLSFGTALKRASPARPDLEGAVQKARYEEQWTEFGNCGGEMDISFVGEETTGEFTATINARDFCEDGETMDGAMELSGRFDENLILARVTTTFKLVTIRDAEDDFALSGTVVETLTGINPETRLTINFRDNATAKVYRFADYVITDSYAGQGYTETIAGRFFHPDYGYVDVATATPLFFVWGDNLPHSGAALCTGAAGKQSKFTALSAAAYTISADWDGDGVFDDYSSGVVHYPGRNNPPVITAGADALGNVGCGPVSIAGAGASDADTDPLTLSWSFASLPLGSAAVISSADTLAPSFVPDLVGVYVLQLAVADGAGATVQDTVTVTVYGDLFCLNGKSFIPAAAATKPAAVASGDVTGDGRADVVFLTSSTQSVDSDPNQDYHLSVFAQTPQGSLAAPLSYAAGDGFSLTIADLNGDGRNDVAVSARTGVGLFYQTLQGTFAALQLLPFGETIEVYEPHSVVAADFTGDGRSDLVSIYSDFTAAKVRLYVQSSTGTLGPPVLITTDPGEWLAKARDLNGDAQADLLLTGNALGKGMVYLGVFAQGLTQSGGTLGAPATYLFDNSLAPEIFCSAVLALGDVNGDARPDLVASCQDTLPQPYTFLRLYPQQGDGTVGTAVNLTAPASYGRLEAVDLTGDGFADLVGLVYGNDMVFDVFRQVPGGPGAGESYPLGMPNYNYSSQVFAVGDVTGDGYPDLITAVYLSSEGGNGLLLVPGNPNRQ